MASALRSSFPDPHFDREVARPQLETVAPGRRPRRQADVTVIVRPERANERRLSFLKNVSSVACGALVLAAGLAYGERVYVDLQASDARARLTELKQHEHQLSVSIEALQYQAAQLAEETDAGLVPQTPERFIFVEPALSRPDRQRTAPAKSAPPQFPVAY